MTAPKTVPVRIRGHLIGYAEVGQLIQEPGGEASHEIKNLVLLPDEEISEEVKPFVKMLTELGDVSIGE